jgi:hypothetical protein
MQAGPAALAFDLTRRGQPSGSVGVGGVDVVGGRRTAPGLEQGLRLIRYLAHLVLQWCMNSTGSVQP